MNDTFPRGVYAGTAPTERLDPLNNICRLAEIVAQMIQGDDETDYGLPCAEFEELRQAQRILVLNARHVPQAIDEVVDQARSNGGLKS